MKRTLHVHVESWPLREAFTISRGSKTAAEVVLVEIMEDAVTGRGECVPYARYSESVNSVVSAIEQMRGKLCEGLSRIELQTALPPGAARNAVDCALWDLEAKSARRPVWELADLPPPEPVTTAYTLSLGPVDAMAVAARNNAHRPLLKLKLGPDNVRETVQAVRREAPNTRLIIDANEAWTAKQLTAWMPHLKQAEIELIEQPLAAGQDAVLANFDRSIPIAADESCHVTSDLASIRHQYDVVNIKLDKAGGLTEALALRRAVLAAGLDIMVGCMVGTSLAMAPATLLTAGARFVDLDGPLLLAKDRAYGLEFSDHKISSPKRTLWG